LRTWTGDLLRGPTEAPRAVLGCRDSVQLPGLGVIVKTDSAPTSSLPILVAIHGFRGSDEGLSRILEPVSRAGEHRVVSVNLPGMGLSPLRPGAQHDLDALIDLVARFVEHIGAGAPVKLLGHSFGATIASGVAARYPDVVRGLILVSPVVRAESQRRGLAHRIAVVMTGVYGFTISKGPEWLGHRICNSAVPGHVSNLALARRNLAGLRRIREFSHEHPTLPARRQAVSQHLYAASHHGCLEFAPNIRTPTVVIAGDRDALSPVNDLRELIIIHHPAEFILIRGAGHLAHHEDYETVSRAIQSGLSQMRCARPESTAPVVQRQGTSPLKHQSLASNSALPGPAAGTLTDASDGSGRTPTTRS
jgi:pimeloyl-ACP methyl ester carboxylesterase